MRSMRKFNEIMKKRVRPILLAATLLVTAGFASSSSKVVNAESTTSKNITTPSNQVITIDKTAESVGNDLYQIKFDIEGTVPENQKTKADIIVMIDQSNSMFNNKVGNSSRMDVTKNSAKTFVNDIFAKTVNADVRVDVATFGTGAHNICSFSSDKDMVINKINSIVSETGFGNDNGGTNTEAGITQVKSLLGKTRKDAKKYVLFFTDGMPTYYVGDKGYAGAGDVSYDKYFKQAQLAYNEIKGSITHIGGIGKFSQGGYWFFGFHGNGEYYDDETGYGEYSYTKDLNIVSGKPYDISKGKDNYPDTTIYTVGLISGNDSTMATNFLSTIQSACEPSKWKDNGYLVNSDKAEAVEKLKAKFTGIADEISTAINESIIKDGKITDVLPEYFTLPDSAKDKDLNVKVNGKAVTPEKDFMTKDENGHIVLDLSKIAQTPENNKVKIEISYNVQVNSYFSGNDIPTNVSAELKGKDPLKQDQEIRGTFPVPHVTIAPKVGSITVEKAVNEENSTFKDVAFPISITRADEGKNADTYNVDIKAGTDNAQTMTFYMRDDETIINHLYANASDNNKNYFKVGTYKISEIVPMDYAKNYTIEWSYNSDFKDEKTTDTFTIDKDHPNVYIRVTNTVKNNSYWRDRDDTSNVMAYKENKGDK